LMAVAYIWRVVEVAWFRPPASGQTEFSEAPVPMLVVTWVAAVANIYFGLAPWLQISLASDAAGVLLGELP